MIRIHNWPKSAAAFATAVLAACAVGSAAAQSPVAANKLQGHEIRLELTKTDIVVGEPVNLIMTVKNVNHPLRIGNFQTSFAFSEGNDLKVLIQPPGELPYRYMGTEDNAIQSSVEVPLDQGKSQSYIQTILYDRKSPNGYAFGQPGEYMVGVTLSHTILREVRKTQTVLGPVKVTVREPQGDAAEAFKLINNAAAAYAIHDGMTTQPAVLQAIRTVADKYPTTPYGKGARYMLGAYNMEDFVGDYQGAIAEFARFLKDYPGDIRTGDAIFCIAFCYDKLGKTDIARGWVYFLKDHDPAHRLLREENPLAAKYYYGMREEGAKRRWWHYETPWNFKPTELGS